MKRAILLLICFSSQLAANPISDFDLDKYESSTSAPEYVKICNSTLHTFEIPGLPICINPSTGIMMQTLEDGTIITTESELSIRISKLETQIKELEAYLNLSEK